MTNLEKYHKILKTNLRVTDLELNDEFLVYNRTSKWNSMTHMGVVADLEEKFGVSFETLDIMAFNCYSAGIEVLKKLGIDMEQ